MHKNVNMSSFVNDNVSESKKPQEHQITEYQENIEETSNTETITTSAAVTVTEETRKSQAEKQATTSTNSVNQVNNIKNENKGTVNENKSESKKENNLTKTTSTSATANNYDNKGNNDVVFVATTTDDKDKNKDKNEEDAAIAIDNNQNLNVTDDDYKLTTTQIAKTNCCVSNMTPGDVEQQVVSTINNKQLTPALSTNIIAFQSTTKTIIDSNSDKGGILATSTLPTKDVVTESKEINVCNEKLPSTTLPVAATETASLPPLSQDLVSLVSDYHLPHISSEPAFGLQLQHNNKTNNSPIKTASSGAYNWLRDTSAPNCSSAVKSGIGNSSASPSMVRKTSGSLVLLPRRVSFPKSDNELVTGYLEPANPWEHVYMVKSISEIAELYITSCHKHNTKPLQTILDHLKAVDLTKQLRRQPLLSLKSIKLAPSDCEALEEVLKRVQYKSIDLTDCKLDETAASALFDMIEYYEAAQELDISSNAAGMTHRGWTSCIYMVSHSQELQVLNAEGNPISKISADHLGNALSTSNLHTLKLEHCGLKGAPLSGLCFKLYHNKVLKELWLAHNDLDCNDADTIAEMLKCNHYLELIDISNNNIRDEGLRHIVKALIMQAKELERRTTFQRTAAIDDDGECMSPVESSPSAQFVDNDDDDDALLDCNKKEQETNETGSLKITSKNIDVVGESNLCELSLSLPSIEEKVKRVEIEMKSENVLCEQHKVKPPLISSVGSTIDENDGDEDTDDTVRSSTIKNSVQSTSGGQSMLDKLLSMNSESSSDDGASNLSTDTLAACNSEEASLISDDIFDSAATNTTITSTNATTKVPTNTGLKINIISESSVAVTSATSSPAATKTPMSEAFHDGQVKKDEMSLQQSFQECELIEHNDKITVEKSSLVLINSPTNLSNSSNVQSSLNNNNNNADSQPTKMPLSAVQTASSPAFSNNAADTNVVRSDVFEVTAEESDCLMRGISGAGVVAQVVASDDEDIRTGGDRSSMIQHHIASRALDVNKNTKLGEDFDDTHSTDSAFESASEGDISRHLPEEFTRLSTSLESTRFDDIAKELAIETATIASESNECLITAAAQVTPSSTPTPPTPPFTNLSTPLTERGHLSAELPINSCLSFSLPTVTTTTTSTVQAGFTSSIESFESPITNATEVRDKMPKVTIAQDSFMQKYKSNSALGTSPSCTPTPPPPSTSPGGASSGLRRTESTACGFLTQSSRNRSQSTDSLCSDNSLDGSIGSGDLSFSSSSHLNEKITKNDTLTRQQRPVDAAPEISTRTPGGLKALAVWNNNLTKESGLYISDLLAETVSLELLNIGKNCLSNEFIASVKESLTKNITLTTLGLQSAHLSAKGIETLSSILTFGGNNTLQRIDIRDNKLEVESLTKIADVLKSNTIITQIDIDDEPKRLSVGSEAHLDYARVLENVRSMCSRNEKSQAQMQQEKSAANVMAKRRGGYYLGSRKISLTCQSRPVMDATKNVLVSASNSKLDIKRKAGTRLRSPVPSPTTISPSSSPNRASRFQVFRVPESSSLTSPNTQKPIGSNLVTAKAVSLSSAAISLSPASERGSIDPIYPNITSTSLPTSCSLPSMATISSSTQSIKRLSISPRSRFVVRKVYEDPNLPLASSFTQPIIPPINSPATLMSRNVRDSTTGNLETTAPKQFNKRPEDVRQKSFSSGCSSSSRKLAPPVVEPQVILPSAFAFTPPTILTPQQEINTTTDNSTETITTTHNLEFNQDTLVTTKNSTVVTNPETVISETQKCEQSTKNTIDKNITKQTPTTIETIVTSLSTATVTIPMSSSNLQPTASIFSTLSSSSSSASSSSSSSSSTSPASNTDSSESSSVHSNEALIQQQQQSHDLTSNVQCPIAVFSDNDITLTKNTVNEIFGPVAASAKENSSNSVETSNENVIMSTTAAQQQHEHQLQQQQQPRIRKVSWISNPTAVDKLLTLFRRSSSPESKTVATSTTTMASIPLSQSPPTYAEAAAAAVMTSQQQQQQKSQISVVPLRKQSPPSWTKLGNDILTAAAANNVDLANIVATTSTAVVTEQSRSFFDAASKQFFDFSKQVFRQNLSFGNEPVTTASTSTTSSAFNVQPTASESGTAIFLGRTGEHCVCGCLATTTGCLCGNTITTECSADLIPTEVKQEIKENISPQHTINEETLNSLQKLYGSSAATTEDLPANTTSISSASNAAVLTPTPPPPLTTPATQIQQSTVTVKTGNESELTSHNT